MLFIQHRDYDHYLGYSGSPMVSHLAPKTPPLISSKNQHELMQAETLAKWSLSYITFPIETREMGRKQHHLARVWSPLEEVSV